MSGFYSFLGFTRLLTGDAVRKAIAEGVEKGLFGYTTGTPALGDDGKFQVARGKVVFARPLAEDELDLDSGFLMAPPAIPAEPQPPGPSPVGPGPQPPKPPEPSLDPSPQPTAQRGVQLEFSADRSQLYGAWNALANLADMVGKVKITATAESEEGFDQSRLQNGVLEPLREMDLID